VRPKLLAIEVSGRHRVPVIARASSHGRQARAGGHGPRDVTQPQDLSRVATGKSFPGHRPDRHRRACTPPDGRSAQYRDRARVWRAGRWITWVRWRLLTCLQRRSGRQAPARNPS